SHSYSTESWCDGEGIWVGHGIEEQIRIKINRRNLAAARKVDSTNGFWVRKAGLVTLKLLMSERMGREMEAEYEEE
ncbi:MAG: hypothetical protein J6J86_01455, partial [Lachnospiraceae bacterium]|nr:hypothetical protein [Lachnospiraceae bacterium]